MSEREVFSFALCFLSQFNFMRIYILALGFLSVFMLALHLSQEDQKLMKQCKVNHATDYCMLKINGR